MSEDAATDVAEPGVRARGRPGFVEPRWPVALTIGVFIGITITLRVLVPERETVGPSWAVPVIEIAMLAALLLADPTRIVQRRSWLRPISLGLVMVLAGAVFFSTFKLIKDLIEGGQVTHSASALLASGGIIWMGNILIFGLLYWLLDSGGPTARWRGERQYPDFAFSQQLSPELAPPGWRPIYVDYLILGLTTSTAFSPTDVMPMSSWAKLLMAAQSLISLFVVGLVIARAVNIFS
jgi:uncharacterized membrane protein